MSYTRAPVNDTHNTVRLKVSQSSYLTTRETTPFPMSLNYIDCFPLTEKNFAGDPRHRASKREAYVHQWDLTTNAGLPGNTVLVANNTDRVFFTRGDKGYAVRYNQGSPVISEIFTNSTAYQATGTNAIGVGGARRVAFLCGDGTIYHTDEVGGDLKQAQPTQSLVAAKGLEFMDGYLFAIGSNGYLYNSNVANDLLTWKTTDYLDAEQYPDPINFIAKQSNYLIAFGSQSIEFFYNAGIAVGSPLTRQQTLSSRIGSLQLNNPGKSFCKINDDIYFLGKNNNSYVGLYRIQNTKVEEVTSQYISGVLNQAVSPTQQIQISGLETVLVNNNPMVMINFTNTNQYPVYYPETNSWIIFSNTDIGTHDERIGQMWVSDSWGGVRAGKRPYFFRTNGALVKVCTADLENTQANTATYITEVVDLGINFRKHFARVDAIGDYGQNLLSLTYFPNQRYTNPVTCQPTRTQGGLEKEAVSWFNLGNFRRAVLQITMSGVGPAYHEGFDITYNVGAA